MARLPPGTGSGKETLELHASYRGLQPSTGVRLLCVKPTAEERTSSFNRRVVWDGRTYWCKR